MKRIVLFIMLCVAFAACKKDHPATQPMAQGGILGKWAIRSVITIGRDTAGKEISNGEHVYNISPGEYFQFNANGTWMESILPDSIPGIGIFGNYVINSAASFTLKNSNPDASEEVCTISALSQSSLVFSHQRSTTFNGVIPGYIEYIFNLAK